jgi:hypothetical protein
MATCKWFVAWIGRCKSLPVEGSDFCEKHRQACVSCGAEADHDCEETMQFVCGLPLCANCEHTIQSNGCNSGGLLPPGIGSHCRKSEQVYKPWYAQEGK